MKHSLFLLLVIFIPLSVRAETMDVFGNTGTQVATPTITIETGPVSQSKATSNIEIASTPTPATEIPSAGSNWPKDFEVALGLSIAIPESTYLTKGYNTGLGANVAIGWRPTDDLALDLDIDAVQFSSKDPYYTNDYNYSLGDLALLAKIKLLPGDIRPYLILGPALALNQYSNRSQDNSLTINSTVTESDFLMECGVGVEVKLNERLGLYVQGKLAWDFASQTFATYNGIQFDETIFVIPIQAGVITPF